MQLNEYNNALATRYEEVDEVQKENIFMSVMALLATGRELFFDPFGKYKPIKWHSFKRIFQIAGLTADFVGLIIRIVKK